MRNILSIILKGIGITLGVVLLVLGGFMGLENLQAPGTINVPHSDFFSRCHPRGINHTMARVKEK